MAQITSSVGLISGINTGAIIDGLISIDSEPITLLQTQISSAQNQQGAYGSLETQLSAMQTIGNSLALPQTFQAATTNSSNTNVLTATAGTAAAVGTYQFQVAQLVSTQQSISTGFADPTTTPVGAGTITLEEGGGEASSQTTLAQLNGGAGVTRGQFEITDRGGNSAVIDTSNDITLDDVVNQINNTLGISVHASVSDNGLVLTDTSGKTTSNLSVQDLNGGSAAADLGIAQSVASNTLAGTDINSITDNTALSQLNDGNGVSTTTAGQNDFSVNLSDGTVVQVQLNGATTVGNVIADINTVGGAKLIASINSAGNGITLTDHSGGSGALTVTPENGSSAAANLGLTGAASGNTIQGAPLIAGLDSVLVRSLNGGSGLALGTISVTDRAGAGGSINLSGATSVSDIINDINNNNVGANVTASLNAAGTGIQIVDNSGGSGNLVIGNVSGTTATALGIAGTFTTATPVVNGANLQRQYVSGNTLLSTYGGGTGVELGQFTITNSAGGQATIDLSQGTFNTIGDVINAINSKKIGVTASIDPTGNGLLLTDTAGGAGKLTVTNNGSSTATDLNIAGTATGTTIDGALQKTIAVSSTDTLATLQTKINQAGFGVVASIINDGSTTSPYRLSLTAINSGEAGRVLIDSGTTNLNIHTLVNAQDAAVFYGGSGGTQPLLINSNTNQLSNIINGVTVNLVSASSTPVTLSVTPDPSGVVAQLQNFVTDFNSLVGTINSDTQYNTSTNQGGILLGDGTTEQIQENIYNMITSVVNGVGQYKDLADIGITVNTTSDPSSGTTLDFDANTFESAFATDPTAVQNLFSEATVGLGNVIAKSMSTLTDPVNGVVTLQDNTLSTEVQQYQDQINELNAIIADKKTQLENEFNNMEETLATLQSQGSLLTTLSALKVSTPSSSASSASTTGSSSSSSSSSG